MCCVDVIHVSCHNTECVPAPPDQHVVRPVLSAGPWAGGPHDAETEEPLGEEGVERALE